MADFIEDLGTCPVPDCDWHIEGPEAVVGEPLFVLGGQVTHLRTHSDDERDAALSVVVDAVAAMLTDTIIDQLKAAN